MHSELSIIADNIQDQYNVGDFIYDMYFTVKDSKFLLEYNEKYHTKTVGRDRQKYNQAVNLGYIYISVPYNKEYDFKELIKGFIINKECKETINDTYWFKFNSLLNPIYARTLNERVFGTHITGMRNLASSKELRLISDIEKHVINCILQGFLKCESDIIKSIKTYGL